MSEAGRRRSWRWKEQLSGEIDGEEEVPSDFGQVGKRVALVLAAAERSARQMRDEAVREADELGARAEADAKALELAATNMQREAERAAAEAREAAVREAEEVRERAEEDARRIVASAERKAAGITRAAERHQRDLEGAIENGEHRLQQLAETLHQVAARLEQMIRPGTAAGAESASPGAKDDVLEALQASAQAAGVDAENQETEPKTQVAQSER